MTAPTSAKPKKPAVVHVALIEIAKFANYRFDDLAAWDLQLGWLA